MKKHLLSLLALSLTACQNQVEVIETQDPQYEVSLTDKQNP